MCSIIYCNSGRLNWPNFFQSLWLCCSHSSVYSNSNRHQKCYWWWALKVKVPRPSLLTHIQATPKTISLSKNQIKEQHYFNESLPVQHEKNYSAKMLQWKKQDKHLVKKCKRSLSRSSTLVSKSFFLPCKVWSAVIATENKNILRKRNRFRFFWHAITFLLSDYLNSRCQSYDVETDSKSGRAKLETDSTVNYFEKICLRGGKWSRPNDV